MNHKIIQTNDGKPLVETRGGLQDAEEIELIDLGRASERTRGSISGFIIEPSAFPLREL